MQNQSSIGNLVELIRAAYAVIDNLTPMKTDCGKLCGKICCKGDEAGMLLFPGEESLFAGVPGFRIEEIEYMDVSEMKLLICDGVCTRDLRPLACRIFPCAPNIDIDGNITAAGDIRGRRMCPIWDLKKVDKNFIEAVEKAFDILSKDETMLFFMRLISAEQSMLWRFFRK